MEKILPISSKNSVVIALASDNNYVPVLGVALTSILNSVSEAFTYDIIILSDKISKENKEYLKGYFGRDNVSIRIVECSNYLDKQKFVLHNTRLSRSTYSRMLMVDLFENFDKVLYLDCDVVVNEDLATLYQHVNFKGELFAAVEDPAIKAIRGIRPSCENYINSNIKLIKGTPYFNAGVLVFNLKEIKKEYSSKKLIDLCVQKKWLWQDQDVLNLIAKGRVKLLPCSWNMIWTKDQVIQDLIELDPDYVKSIDKPKIIHYAGGILPIQFEGGIWGDIFWSVARQSPYYEKLLMMMIQKLVVVRGLDSRASEVNTMNENVLKKKIKIVANYYRLHGLKNTLIKICKTIVA